VRGWVPWHRFVTLCLLAHAYLVVLRLQARIREAEAHPGRAAAALLPLTVPEVRRLVLALGEPAERRAFRLGWSWWRRKHQAIAARGHTARRARSRTPPAPEDPDALPPTPAAVLTEAEWARVLPLLPPQRPTVGRPRHDHRSVLSGIVWVLRRRASWRAMPKECGKWATASYTGATGSAVAERPWRPERLRPRLIARPPPPTGRRQSGPYRVAPTTHHEGRRAPPARTLGPSADAMRREMERTTATYRLFVGIDVAAATVVAAWRRPEGAPGAPCTWEQTPIGHAALQQRLGGTGIPAAETLVVPEATGSYWVTLAVALHEAGFRVAVINPLQAHHLATARPSTACPTQAGLRGSSRAGPREYGQRRVACCAPGGAARPRCGETAVTQGVADTARGSPCARDGGVPRSHRGAGLVLCCAQQGRGWCPARPRATR